MDMMKEESFKELVHEGKEAYKRVFTLSIEIDRCKEDYKRLRNIVSELKETKEGLYFENEIRAIALIEIYSDLLNYITCYDDDMSMSVAKILGD
jgi:FtsZ-binding cell division protein ZapB